MIAKPTRQIDGSNLAMVARRVAAFVVPRRNSRYNAKFLQIISLALGILALSRAESAEPIPASASHWAFQPLRSVASTHSIDSFIHEGLKSRGLGPNPPSEPRELIRRVYFDLLGLPPSPQEVDAFVADPSPKQYEALIERLLASPHYGERWGRHWLDLARYTESTGFEYDRIRDNAWPYRDYVIRSFNEDKPYDRFIQEQIAGDVLEPVTREGIAASSLLVSGPYDQAGNAQANVTQRMISREDELEDLLSVVGQTFLGLTINCARCHDHKFDPISSVEYYQIKSVFDGVKHGERPWETPDETRTRESQRSELRRAIKDDLAFVSRLEDEGAQRVLKLPGAATRSTPPPAWQRWSFDLPNSTNSLPSYSLQGGATIENGRLHLPKEGSYLDSTPLTADIREKTLEAWISLAALEQSGGAPISLETSDGARFDAIVFGERQPRKWTAGSEGFARTQDLDAPEESATTKDWVHIAAVYRGDNSISLYRNGVPYGATYTPPTPLMTFKAGEARLVLGRRHKGGGKPWFLGSIRQAALYNRALSSAEITQSFKSAGYVVPTEEILARLSTTERELREKALRRIEDRRTKEEKLKAPPGAIYAGVRIQPEPTRVFLRGDVRSPKDTVTPAGLSAIHGVSPDFGLAGDAPEAERRRRFAAWLTHPDNPLPLRVMANRVWHYHFGQGLVSTPSDFGLNGARPSHPELLDWLATQLRQNGGRVKSLHRLIMNSATYRQSSRARSEALEVDADNRWLWRYPTRRLEAEAVRDACLSVSGQLNSKFGGPSFRPFTTTEFNATFYHPFDKGDPEYNRRTVYRINVNSGKEPMLDVFDCPDPSVKTPRRSTTTTPLQALNLMNSSFVQRQSRHLAERALELAQQDLPRAIHTAYQLTLSRPATPEELQRAVTATRERGLPSVCWALLNSTEFVYVR